MATPAPKTNVAPARKNRLRRFLRISFNTIGTLLLACSIGFLALTRTELGRDALRKELEHRFASISNGRLEIGRLSGNLRQQLFASDIRFFDAQGHLSVHIDSLVANPRWQDVLSRRFSASSLKVIRPTFFLRYEADSTWNLASVFRQSRSPDNSWSFRLADIHIVDGTLESTHETALPPVVEAGWIFNIAATRIDKLSAKATLAWERKNKQLTLHGFSAMLPDLPFNIDHLQGQVMTEPGRLQLHEFALESGAIQLETDGVAIWEGSVVDGAFTADQLDFDALKHAIPRLPLAGNGQASTRIHGSIDTLLFEDLHLASGTSTLRGTGVLRTRPDLNVDLVLERSILTPADLHTLLPDATLPGMDHLGTLDIEGEAHLQGNRIRVDGSLHGAAGQMELTATLNHQTETYVAEVVAQSLNADILTRRDRGGSLLNGTATIEGQGFSLGSMQATVQCHLENSRIAGRPIDNLSVEATIANHILQAKAIIQREQQHIDAEGYVTLDSHPLDNQFFASVTTQQLDLGMLLGSESLQSSLNSAWTLSGGGETFDFDDLYGALTVHIDTSTVQWDQESRLLPTHTTEVTLRKPSAHIPRLEVSGDVLSLGLDDSRTLTAWRPAIRLWGEALRQAYKRQKAKQYLATIPSDMPSIPGGTILQDSVHLDVNLHVRRSDILHAWLPVTPVPYGNMHAQLQLSASGDWLKAEGSIAADSLSIQAWHSKNVRASFDVSATLEQPLEESIQVTLDVQADQLIQNDRVVGNSVLLVRGKQGSAWLNVNIDNPKTHSAQLAGKLELHPDRYQLTVHEMQFALDNSTWRQPKPATIDLYTDAVVFNHLQLESPALEGARQQIRIHGTQTGAPQDTLFLSFEAIEIQQFSPFLHSRHALGGRLNGQVAWTDTGQPQITGNLSIEDLSLNNQILGHLEAFSRYLPGTPDVAITAALTPMLRADPRQVENDLQLVGTFRLPSENDRGILDLALDVQRADAFFLEYIISGLEVQGALNGTGTIRGSFAKPIFGANMALRDASFYMPRFNLRYEAEANVYVDEQGIVLDTLSLRDSAGGTAAITGRFSFNDYQYFSLDIAGQLDNIDIINVDTFTRNLAFYGTIQASGDVILTGPIYNAYLRSDNIETSPKSELFIPIVESERTVDPGFIIFADSTGRIPEVSGVIRRENILDRRAENERTFAQGIEIDLNILAPQGSTVHLVIDPLLGDVINAVGGGRIQLQLRENNFATFGTFDVNSGDYLLTAGDVFVRRFLIDRGSITWTGEPSNPGLDIYATYRTRASRTGLPNNIGGALKTSLPVIVGLDITGKLNAVLVDLSLALDRSRQEAISDTPLLEAYLNQPDRAAEHATSVLLTNSFLLSTENTSNSVLAGSAFNSVSHLVSSQINRYLGQLIPNADFTIGLQSNETAADLDVSAGIALRLLNERLVIRGQGVYHNLGDPLEQTVRQGLQGEFVVEIRLSPSVAVEIFYRREGDVLSETLITSETGAGLTYHTEFSSWKKLFHSIFGRKEEDDDNL